MKNGTAQLWTATDLEGHIGLDGRLYIIDFSRSFPPEAPNTKSAFSFWWHSIDISRYERSYLYHLLRPEYVKQYSKPLCPDAFSNFIIHDENATEYNTHIYEATLNLFKTVWLLWFFCSGCNDMIGHSKLCCQVWDKGHWCQWEQRAQTLLCCHSTAPRWNQLPDDGLSKVCAPPKPKHITWNAPCWNGVHHFDFCLESQNLCRLHVSSRMTYDIDCAKQANYSKSH